MNCGSNLFKKKRIVGPTINLISRTHSYVRGRSTHLYIYITETFEASTIFYVSTILKTKKKPTKKRNKPDTQRLSLSRWYAISSLPSFTSSSLIRPTANQPQSIASHLKTHHTHKPTYIFFLGIDLLPQTTNLIQTTHIQPLQPRNGDPFAMGLIKPMATDSSIKTHHSHHAHQTHHAHRHLLPENRGRAPSSDHPFVNLEIKESFLHWALPQIIESPPSSLEY